MARLLTQAEIDLLPILIDKMFLTSGQADYILATGESSKAFEYALRQYKESNKEKVKEKAKEESVQAKLTSKDVKDTAYKDETTDSFSFKYLAEKVAELKSKMRKHQDGLKMSLGAFLLTALIVFPNYYQSNHQAATPIKQSVTTEMRLDKMISQIEAIIAETKASQTSADKNANVDRLALALNDFSKVYYQSKVESAKTKAVVVAECLKHIDKMLSTATIKELSLACINSVTENH